MRECSAATGPAHIRPKYTTITLDICHLSGTLGITTLPKEPRMNSLDLIDRKIIAALRAGDDPGLRLAIRMDVTQGLRMLAV